MHLIMLEKLFIHFIQVVEIVSGERGFHSFSDKSAGENSIRIGEEYEYMLKRLLYASYTNGIRVSFDWIQRDTQCWSSEAFTKEWKICLYK